MIDRNAAFVMCALASEALRFSPGNGVAYSGASIRSVSKPTPHRIMPAARDLDQPISPTRKVTRETCP